jgi:hypothetical protein
MRKIPRHMGLAGVWSWICLWGFPLFCQREAVGGVPLLFLAREQAVSCQRATTHGDFAGIIGGFTWGQVRLRACVAPLRDIAEMPHSIAPDIKRELMEILRLYYSVVPGAFATGLDRKLEGIVAEQELRERLEEEAA